MTKSEVMHEIANYALDQNISLWQLQFYFNQWRTERDTANFAHIFWTEFSRRGGVCEINK